MIPPDLDAPKPISPHRNNNNYPYASSIASFASSSSSSVFSTDSVSSQSSAPSSAKSTENASWDAESTSSHAAHFPISSNVLSTDRSQDAWQDRLHPAVCRAQPQVAVAPELRVHPRRTRPSAAPNTHGGAAAARPPPSLVRQCDRKDNFVESLVDTTTQMIEVIWPLSVVPCERDNGLGSKNLIGLRTFIQEVLKRSKTSYSTLQVALYYLVLIKPFIPNVDFTKEQPEDSHVSRVMQCGRRMFLAALILASKYLQDRNYSARAWGRISGLTVSEINVNELAFVKAVDWKLHIPEARFQLWTDVVLKYSLSPRSPPCSPVGGRLGSNDWRSIIPRLTPELVELDMADFAGDRRSSDVQCRLPMSPPASAGRGTPEWSACGQQPRAAISKPMAMEPPLRASKENTPRFPPISPRITQLPTPSMTPANFGTPAACSTWRCPASSMSTAMKQVHSLSMTRTTVDTWPSTLCLALHPRPRSTLPAPRRRSSLAPSLSSSSPESMVSDVSSRSSRSSSISSVASSTGALPQPTRLAVQATRRCANMHLAGAKDQRTETAPHWAPVWSSSPAMANYPYEDSCVRQEESYLRHDPVDPKPDASSAFNLPSRADAAAAECLRSLHMDQADHRLPSPRTKPTRKRERPTSVSDVELQQAVRAQLAHTLSDISHRHGLAEADDDAAIADSMIANSFVLNGFKLSETPTPRSSHVRSMSGSREGSRKRSRCVEEVQGMGLTGPFGSGSGRREGIV